MQSHNQSKLLSHYLKVMGIESIKQADLAFLSELTIKHMLAFGWDTIDLYLQRKISLEPETIISRFIKENRGGVCYESAIAFCYLLNKLGFEAYVTSAYTHGYNDHVFSYSIDTHIVIIAILQDKKYLVDISWDPPFPILLTDMNYFSYGRDQYRLRYEALSERYFLEKWCSSLWKKQYAFALMPFQSSSFYNNLATVIEGAEYESFKKLKIMKLTKQGTVALFNKNFITVEYDQEKIKIIEDDTEIKKILKNNFLIKKEFIDLYF